MTSVTVELPKIEVVGVQEFLGKEIPVIEGGFGEAEKVVLAKTIAEIHEVELKVINQLINNSMDEFEEDIDIIDLKNSVIGNDSLLELGFSKQSIANSSNIYLLSEQGYMALVGFMKTDKSKELRKKFRREYFAMRKVIKEKKSACIEDVLIQSLQEMKALKQQINEATHHALVAKAEVKTIKDVVSLDTTSWRSETRTLIAKMARAQGDLKYIRDFTNESYELLNKRFGVSLETRLTNKRRRMAEEGVSKSKRDNLNNLDVIAEDKKLIEGYVAIVKDMAIKYGI